MAAIGDPSGVSGPSGDMNVGNTPPPKISARITGFMQIFSGVLPLISQFYSDGPTSKNNTDLTNFEQTLNTNLGTWPQADDVQVTSILLGLNHFTNALPEIQKGNSGTMAPALQALNSLFGDIFQGTPALDSMSYQSGQKIISSRNSVTYWSNKGKGFMGRAVLAVAKVFLGYGLGLTKSLTQGLPSTSKEYEKYMGDYNKLNWLVTYTTTFNDLTVNEKMMNGLEEVATDVQDFFT